MYLSDPMMQTLTLVVPMILDLLPAYLAAATAAREAAART